MLLDMLAPKFKMKGMTVVEFMVASALGLLLITGLLATTAYVLTYSMSVIRSNQMQYSLQNVLNLIAADVRRSGYWGNAVSSIATGTNNNPFTTTNGTNLSIQSINSGTNNCILFASDTDKSGVISNTTTVNANEHFGYRLSANAVQGMTVDQDYNCSSGSNTWENITNPNLVRVTNLNFNLTTRTITLSSGSTLTIRLLTATVTGELANDPSTVTTLSQMIKVRTDLHS